MRRKSLLALGLAFLLTPALGLHAAWTASKAEAARGTAEAVLAAGPPPVESEEAFVLFMMEKRKEDEKQLRLRYRRFREVAGRNDLYRPKESNAFLMTPREEFCRKGDRGVAYEDRVLMLPPHGVTMSGPHMVSRMTSALDLQPGEKVLEIGTGSGYQSAVLANLTDKVYTIEIIEALAAETDGIYRGLVARGYTEYRHITRKADDGYYGWEEYAPFDKIIVTCGIDHIPPPLLGQLKVGGVMCIPVGPPTAQVLLRVAKDQDKEGNITISREDIFKGRRKVVFVPFTKKGGGTHFK